MEHVRWINDHELRDDAGAPIEGVLQALYVISNKLNFVIKTDSVETTRAWLDEHDATFREYATEISDELKDDFAWDASRRCGFYRLVAHYGRNLVTRVYISEDPQHEWEKFTLDALLSVIPRYLKND